MSHIGPFTFVACRFLTSALFVAPFVWRERKKRAAIRAVHVGTKTIIILCAFFAAAVIAQQAGLAFTSVTNAAWLTGTYVAMVPFAGLALYRQKLSLPVLLASSLSLLGVWLLTGGRLSAASWGDLLMLLCAACFAFQVPMMGHIVAAIKAPFTLSLLQYFMTGLIALLLAAFFESIDARAIAAAWQPILYAGVASGGIAYTLQAVAQQHTPSVDSAIIMSSESLFGAVGGAWLLHERMDMSGYAGCAAILASIVLVELIPQIRSALRPPMNYRHIFHAGNICDVVKHGVLTLMIEHLKAKEAPFCVIDTHAGIGIYDLTDERATKTNEAQDGILNLLDAPRLPELAPYYTVLEKMNIGWNGQSSSGFRYYPGSPLLATHMLRMQDRLAACELHPDDAEQLKRQLFPYKQAQAHRRNGYEALNAFLPSAEKRGLVLIDPPFEAPDEFAALAAALKNGYARWPQGIFMAWYPIKERPAIWRFHEMLIAGGMPKILAAEFIYREETEATRLNGSGLIIVNPPWKIDERLGTLFPELHKALSTTHRGSDVKWLAGE